DGDSIFVIAGTFPVFIANFNPTRALIPRIQLRCALICRYTSGAVADEVMGVPLIETDGSRSQPTNVHTRKQRSRHSFSESFNGIKRLPYQYIFLRNRTALVVWEHIYKCTPIPPKLFYITTVSTV